MATMQQPLAGFSTDAAPDLSSRVVQERLSQPAVRAFFKLAQAWQLRDEMARQVLGGVSNGFFYQLKKGQKENPRPGQTHPHLVVSWNFPRSLNILYSRKLADAWMNLPNTNLMFAGETPLAYAVKGGVPALMRIRQLLDARRGGR